MNITSTFRTSFGINANIPHLFNRFQKF